VTTTSLGRLVRSLCWPRMKWPDADVDVDRHLVLGLLREQHPDLAHLELVAVSSGWDNTLWRLGDELAVRLPRRESAASLTANEQRWLPVLGPVLPLPVPVPVRVGRPSPHYPWPWSVVPWFEGEPGDRGEITRPTEAARTLGRFLAALHRRAPRGAPHNPFRGVGLAERCDTFEERVSVLEGEIDVDAVRTVWERGSAATAWTGPGVWLHGDLHPANIVVTSGTVSAVVDFGDLCAGDPATDVAGVWLLLPAAATGAFHEAYGTDDALERRGRAWAVLFALMLLEIGLESRPSYARVARAALSRVVGP